MGICLLLHFFSYSPISSCHILSFSSTFFFVSRLSPDWVLSCCEWPRAHYPSLSSGTLQTMAMDFDTNHGIIATALALNGSRNTDIQGIDQVTELGLVWEEMTKGGTTAAKQLEVVPGDGDGRAHREVTGTPIIGLDIGKLRFRERGEAPGKLRETQKWRRPWGYRSFSLFVELP